MAEMVRVKMVKRYNDFVLKKIQEVDAEFETDGKRAKYLVNQGMVEIVGGAKTERKEKKSDEKKEDV